MSIELVIKDISCPSCIAKIEKAVSRVDGVDRGSIQLGFNSGKLRLEAQEGVSAQDIVDVIEKLGYSVDQGIN